VEGDGKGWLAKYLTHKPPAVYSLTKRQSGIFPSEAVRAIIDGRTEVKLHGPRDMPVWGSVFRRSYERRTVRPPTTVSPTPPHFPVQPLEKESESFVRENVEALVVYLQQIQH